MPRRLLRMVFIDASSKVLSWLGRQGTRAVAALVVVGIALPWVGKTLKPYVSEAVFVLLCIAFLRMDSADFKVCIRRPFIVGAATVWTSVVVPVLFGICCIALSLDKQAPGLFLGFMLQAIASPMMAAPALAAIMGLDATLVLVTLTTSTALIPLTAPMFAYFFIEPTLSISPWLLASKLFAILVGASLVGFLARRIIGTATIERHNDTINGLNILVLFVFVAALMENVGDRFIAAPMITIGLTAIAFLIFFAVFLVTTILFMFTGRERALALAFMVSQRNMGLMLAATGGILPDLTWLYFALSQFPIYLSPHLLRPIMRLILKLPGKQQE